MFFLSDIDANFGKGRGKDKKKRKYRLGSLSVLTTAPAALVGAGLGSAISKNKVVGGLGGALIGTGLGYGAGKLMDKSGKFEDYNKAIHNQRTLDKKKNKYFY